MGAVGGREAVATALDEAAHVAEESARDQRAVAQRARRLAREQRRDGSVDQPARTADLRGIVAALNRGAQRLLDVVGLLRRSWARSLADEGLSTRQIGERFGVSHQRVSALLSRNSSGTSERSGR